MFLPLDFSIRSPRLFDCQLPHDPHDHMSSLPHDLSTTWPIYHMTFLTQDLFDTWSVSFQWALWLLFLFNGEQICAGFPRNLSLPMRGFSIWHINARTEIFPKIFVRGTRSPCTRILFSLGQRLLYRLYTISFSGVPNERMEVLDHSPPPPIKHDPCFYSNNVSKSFKDNISSYLREFKGHNPIFFMAMSADILGTRILDLHLLSMPYN